MERELFDWENWDGDMDCMTFYPCTLKVDIGPYKFGETVYGIELLFNKGILQVFDEEGNIKYKCKIHLKLGEQC